MRSVVIKNIKNDYYKGKKKRIAAYCRVSTGLEEQQSSLKNQTEAFYRMISLREDWTLAGIYADEGFSGTQAADRPEFQRLIEDCKAGKIDYIITKSISRFARNTLECISYIRQLKELGVYIFFEENGLDTGTEASELVLSILAAVAQEESRAISSNVKWSLEKKFRSGQAKWSGTYGYRKVESRDFLIDPETAPIVKRIFYEYYHGASLPTIAKDLEKDAIPSPGGGSRWWPKVVNEILKNEKYIGDVLCQKSYTTDHLSHHRVKNLNSEAAVSYYIKDHHEPIVSRELFQQVHTIFTLKDKRQGSVQYPYHTFLICPFCQKPMIRNILEEHGRPGIWHCSHNCSFYYIYERDIDSSFLKLYQRHLKTADSQPAKPEYYMLAEQVLSITFSNDTDPWKYMQVHWKDGTDSQIEMKYRRSRDIPGSTHQKMFHQEKDLHERRKYAGNRH